MSASIWAPGTAVDANNSVKVEAFTAAEDQVLFTINDFQYELATGSLHVFISGLYQIPGVDFTETSSTSFTLTEPVSAGTIVVALGFVEVVSGQEFANAAAVSAAEAAASAAAAAATVATLNNVTISTDDPSGGNDGDLWFKVSA